LSPAAWRRAAVRLGVLPLLAVVVGLALAATGCDVQSGAYELSRKAKTQWERGEYEESARSFVALTEIYPASPLVEESLFWAGCLYDYFLSNPALAIRQYQAVSIRFPDGELALEARENLARLYARDETTFHRAVQVYRQLLEAKELRPRREEFQFALAELYLRMGRMDQARYEFRAFLQQFPKSDRRGQIYYMIGYSYFLQRRRAVALAVMQQTVRDFPDTPVAAQAQFFVADTQEEQGHLQEALQSFRKLQGHYHAPRILEKRIEMLEARMRRSVR
jgi:TolA-binding protein